MRHFLQYWKNYNSAKERGTPLDFAASAQFKKLLPGDSLWIVALREHKLTLLGRLVIGEDRQQKGSDQRAGRKSV
jgi:hypothetical protein